MTDPTPTRDEAVLYARYEPEWGRMMLCNRDQFGAVEYRLASAPAPASGRVDAVAANTHYQAMELAASRLAAAANTLEKLGFPFQAARARDDANLFHARLDKLDGEPASLSPDATPVSEAGPVAWMIQYENGCRSFYICEQLSLPPGHKQTPLYAHAKPASSPAGGDVVREALEEAEETLALVEHPAFEDPQYGNEVRALGERIGYGALMSSASASWRKKLEANGHSGGEFVAGPCLATVANALAKIRAALSQSTSAGRVGE